MITNPDCPNRTFYQYSAVLLTLCALTGCDAFLVSICEFEERPACKAVSSSNSDMAQKTDDGGGPTIAIQERKFERRASFTFAGCQKFNGIIDKKILTLAKSSCTATSAWEAWAIDLNNVGKQYFNNAGVLDYPKIPFPGFNFFTDEIYIAGGKFYYLPHSGSRQLFELVGDDRNQIMNITLIATPQPRAFAHPILNILALAIDPIPGFNHPTFVFSRGFRHIFDSSDLPTNFVVGDLDNNTSNGEEVIAFNGKEPTTVGHWDMSQDSFTADKDLLTSIKMAIDRASPGNPNAIETAFVANVNDDKFPDFIYSRDGQIYVTSYIGKDMNVDSRLKNWTTKVAVISVEKIKSLVAVELTNDAYPELVVETDKAVHFYVNTL